VLPEASAIPTSGTVSIDGKIVRFTRPGLVEEYSVSMDGIRQDFVVLERPLGAGELAVRLAVNGAHIEPAHGGLHLLTFEYNAGNNFACFDFDLSEPK
jgi:hypothetical protein